MITKILLAILLVAVVLVQICWTKPATDNPLAGTAELEENNDLCLLKSKYNNFDFSGEDSSLSPSDQLLIFAVKTFQDHSIKYVQKAKNISEQLLKDNEISTSQTTKILEFKQNLTQFEEKYSSCDDLEILFELVALYSETTSHYFEIDEATSDADDKLILSLLRKYGSEELEDEALNMFEDAIMLEFDKKIEGLKENLLKENGKIDKKLLKWFEQFKALSNADDRIQAFEKFFQLYGEEKISSMLSRK